MEALQHPNVIELLSPTIVNPIVEKYERTITELKNEIHERDYQIQRLQQEVRNLNERLNETNENLIRVQKSKNLMIDGISESVQSEEQMKDKIIEIARSKLDIEIKRVIITRVGKKGSNPRRILVKFSSEELRNDIFNSKTKLRRGPTSSDSDKFIYINEDFSKSTLDILYNARQLKKKQKIKYVWTRMGQVYIKVDENDRAKVINKIKDLTKHNQALDISAISRSTSKEMNHSEPGISLSRNDIQQMANSVLNFTFQEDRLEKSQTAPLPSIAKETQGGNQPNDGDPKVKGQIPEVANDNHDVIVHLNQDMQDDNLKLD